MDKKEFQVYYKGQYLDTLFAAHADSARMKIAMNISVTQISITKINKQMD